MAWLLRDEEENPISNFQPDVLDIIYVHTSTNAEHSINVKLRANFGKGEYSEAKVVPLSKIMEMKWLELDIRCRIHPSVAPSKAKRYIADILRQALTVIEPKRQYRVGRLGTQIIEGKVVFCTGGGLIRPPAGGHDAPDIQIDSTPYNLDIDPNITEGEAIAGMMELISLVPNAGRVILSHTLLYLMRKAYEGAWKAPCCCIFLHGQTGMKKTTFASFMTQLYDRSKGIASPPRLNASIPAAVAILYEKDDCVVTLDDLCPMEATDIKRRQEETLVEITRIIADGIQPARMRGYKVLKAPPRCGAVFTGEYIIGMGSTAARLLSVEMTSPNGEDLKRFQDNPLLVSTFYYRFICWFIENYNDLQALLKEWRTAYQGVNLGVHDRLQEIHYFLNSAFAVFIQFCYVKGMVSDQDAGNLHNSFLRLLTDLVQAQNQRVKKSKPIESVAFDFLTPIRVAYIGGNIILANCPEVFMDGTHDAVVHNGCLFLRSNKIRKIFPGIAVEVVANGLVAQGALKQSGKTRTSQINDCGLLSHGKKKGFRFYEIPLSKLQ